MTHVVEQRGLRAFEHSIRSMRHWASPQIPRHARSGEQGAPAIAPGRASWRAKAVYDHWKQTDSDDGLSGAPTPDEELEAFDARMRELDALYASAARAEGDEEDISF